MAAKDSKKSQQQQPPPSQQQQQPPSQPPPPPPSQSVVAVSSLAFTTMFLHAATHATTVVHGALLGTLETTNKKGGTVVVTITDAIPICHEHPTKPLVEMSLAWIQATQQQQQQQQQENSTKTANKTIVGWYTAPERLDDERPGPAALRIVASLAAAAATAANTATATVAAAEPVLIVLRNGPLTHQVLQQNEKENVVDTTPTTTTTTATSENPNTTNPKMLLAFGKNFGQQWLQPLTVNVEEEETACQAAREQYQQKNNHPKPTTIVDLVDHWESGAEWSVVASKSVKKIV